MLLLVFGSSGSGKTTLLSELPDLDGLTVCDSDEVGVPEDADTAWRQRAAEGHVRRAVELTAAGQDLLLAGQSPLGEILATPSATRLDAIAALLVDCADAERLARLGVRDGDSWPAERLDAFLGWARWMRGHCADPGHAQHVLTDGGWDRMRWDRWTGWRAGDPRWNVERIDTTGRPLHESVGHLLKCVRQARSAPAEASISGHWWD